MNRLRPTAIVLEGGGAKGAYTCGVLHVLREAGINCVAITGASAGALNALAWSVDNLSDARTAWEHLTIWALLGPFSGGHVARLIQLFYAFFIGLPLIAYNLMSDAFSHRRHYLSELGLPTSVLSICFCILLILPLVAITQSGHSVGTQPVTTSRKRVG